MKAVPFDPAFVGQLNLYLSAVDDMLCHPADQPTMGLLLCRGKDRIVVEYALRQTRDGASPPLSPACAGDGAEPGPDVKWKLRGRPQTNTDVAKPGIRSYPMLRPLTVVESDKSAEKALAGAHFYEKVALPYKEPSPQMIGYEFLLSRIPLRMPPLDRPAQIRPVTRVEEMPDLLAVPRHVAPAEGAPILEHVLFALKHEAIQLAVLHEAMKLVPADALLQALTAQRTGGYLRRAAFIWEKANGQVLPLPWGTTGGNYLDLFDRDTYYTGPLWERSAKYRINFNGIGPYEFCPVVRRNAALEQRGRTVLERLHTWVAKPEIAEIVDRVMSWAYLSETRDSYAIENEAPTPDKERAFLSAMQHLRERRALSADYLVELQNVVITSDWKLERGFRSQQNWLQRGGHGALAVRYVPPPPASVDSLMAGLVRMANATEGDVPPLVKAALVSFGFVLIHPFMDGNGRLSRLLAHHSLSFTGALPNVGEGPAILPLSVAMKRNEKDYLAALESFSKPARQLWDVTYVADNDFVFEFRSSPMVYAHWHADAAAAFVTTCAELALEGQLIDETAFIQAYDRAYGQIDKEFDLPNRTINLMIQWIRQNNYRMPERRRNAAELILLKPEQIERIEAIVAECFAAPGTRETDRGA